MPDGIVPQRTEAGDLRFRAGPNAAELSVEQLYSRKAGYNLVSDIKDVNPQKLHMDICGINKKYKLELANPTVKDVEGWVEKI